MTPESPPADHRPLLAPFGPVLLANFLFRLAGAATGLMLTLYLGWINRELYPVTATTLGLMAGGFYLVEMVCSPLLGAESDRRGRRPFLLLGPALGFVAVQITGLSTILPILFLTRLLEGLAAAATTPALLGHLSASTEGDRALRGRVMSLFEAGTALGLTLGSVSGSLLWDTFGRAAFFAVGAIYLASLALFWWTTEHRLSPPLPELGEGGRGVRASPSSVMRLTPRVSAHPTLLQSLATVLRYRPLLGFMPAWLAVNAVVGLWLTHAIYQMTSGRELEGQFLVGAFSSRTLAAILAGYTTAFGLGMVAWGFAFRWLPEHVVMRIAMGGMLGAAACIVLINHSGGPGPLLGAALVGFAISVLVESGFAPAAVSYLARLSSHLKADRGLFMGLYSVVLGLGQILGGWIGGPVADRWGMDGILALTAVLGLLAFALTLRLRPD